MSSDVKIIQPAGILDGTKVNQMRRDINTIIESGAALVLIDLGDVTFMDSSGLGALVIALKAVRTSGGKLFLCSLNDQVKLLFELTSMDRVFQTFPNRAAFEKEILSTL